MLYYHRGYTDFDCREKFFDAGVDLDAVTYLTLANRLIHDFRPTAVTIAEDVSGMPGICCKIEDGGEGFDYRLGMAIPDFWIKMLKDTPDEEWNIWEMWSIMTNRLPGVKTVAYAESHDQALVGDKTIAFRLLDKLMYDSMDRACESMVVDRGMALHKMIRLFTISTGGEAYLNFMGNEFGHPEWIDFPREGNNWSYSYARRQWSLRDNGFLRYAFWADFDEAMIELIKQNKVMSDGYPYNLMMDEENKTMVYSHRDLIFIFNWHPTAAIPDYELPVHEAGKYEVVLSTDEKRFGGLARQKRGEEHFTFNVKGEDGTLYPRLKIYNTSRTAIVLKKID
jgi:1,4-alpha-glucan branching enzyme